MFERLRFARYAWRFERAFRTDRWDAVRACFHPDATYSVTGGGEYDGTVRGPDAIVAFFQRMLNELDRRFDKRVPGLAAVPRVRAGVLEMHWRVRYVLGADSTVLTGTSTCRFEDGKIVELTDTMPIAETEAALALLRRSDRSATPS